MNPTNSTTDELTGKIIGAAMKVHSKLGFGFVESVYENSLAHELRKAGFKVEQQAVIKVYYDGIVVGDFKADLLLNFGARSLEFKRKYRRPKEGANTIGFTGFLGFLAVIGGKLLGQF